MLGEISTVITQSEFVFNSYMPKDHSGVFCLFRGLGMCIHRNGFLFLTFTTIKSISRPWMNPCFWDAIVFNNLRNTSSEIEIFPEALTFEIT